MHTLLVPTIKETSVCNRRADIKRYFVHPAPLIILTKSVSKFDTKSMSIQNLVPSFFLCVSILLTCWTKHVLRRLVALREIIEVREKGCDVQLLDKTCFEDASSLERNYITPCERL